MMNALNENEKNVLLSLVDSSAGNGHDFGWTDEYEADKCPGLNKKQIAGYIGALVVKDYILVSHLADDPGTICNDVQFEFTEKARLELRSMGIKRI